MTLYRSDRPWRLADATQQVYTDNWCPDWCSVHVLQAGPGGDAEGLARTPGRPTTARPLPPRCAILVGDVHSTPSTRRSTLGQIHATVYVTVPNGTRGRSRSRSRRRRCVSSSRSPKRHADPADGTPIPAASGCRSASRSSQPAREPARGRGGANARGARAAARRPGTSCRGSARRQRTSTSPPGIATRPNVIGPFAAVATATACRWAASQGGLELRRLSTMLGYKDVYAPRGTRSPRRRRRPRASAARTRAVAPRRDRRCAAQRRGGRGQPPPARARLAELAAFESLGGPLTRQRLIAPWTRRLLELPATFDEFLAGLGHRTRERASVAMRGSLRGRSANGCESRWCATPHRSDRLIEGAERVAPSTYQRKLGVGFADTPEQRAVARVGLEHGWVRGYLL